MTHTETALEMAKARKKEKSPCGSYGTPPRAKSMASTTVMNEVERPQGHLPEDVLVCILQRLPLKALLRLKTVSRSWLALITGRHFVRCHLEWTKKSRGPHVVLSPEAGALSEHHLRVDMYSYEPGGLVTDHFFRKVLTSEKPGPCSLVMQCCDGLLLLATRTHTQVCNLGTGESRALPPGRPDCHGLEDTQTVGIGFDPSSKEYKVVRHFYRTAIGLGAQATSFACGCEVFTLNSSCRSWETIAEEPTYPVMGNTPVFYDGVACWKIDNSLHRSTPQAFLSLDLRDNKFRVIPPPPSCPDFRRLERDVSLVELDGKLCVVDVHSHKPTVELWKLEGCHLWTPLYVFRLAEVPRCFEPIATHGEKVLVKTTHGLSYFHLGSGGFEPVLDIGLMLTRYTSEGYTSTVRGRSQFFVCSFVESLATVGVWESG